MSQLTVGWSRAESTADLPQDSEVVFPAKAMSVGWKPMLGTSVLDWEAADLLVPPGAGPDAEPPKEEPPRGDGGGPDRPRQEQAGPGGDAGAAPEPPPLRPDPAGAPAVLVTARRTMALFRKNGLVVDVTAPVDATVRAVLVGSVTERRGGRLVGPVRRRLTRTRTVDARANRRTRLILPISGDGRRAIRDYETLKATLQVVSAYPDGRKLTVERRVVLQRRPLKAAKRR